MKAIYGIILGLTVILASCQGCSVSPPSISRTQALLKCGGTFNDIGKNEHATTFIYKKAVNKNFHAEIKCIVSAMSTSQDSLEVLDRQKVAFYDLNTGTLVVFTINYRHNVVMMQHYVKSAVHRNYASIMYVFQDVNLVMSFFAAEEMDIIPLGPLLETYMDMSPERFEIILNKYLKGSPHDPRLRED
jgi:hypothetical protein